MKEGHVITWTQCSTWPPFIAVRNCPIARYRRKYVCSTFYASPSTAGTARWSLQLSDLLLLQTLWTTSMYSYRKISDHAVLVSIVL